MLPVILVICGLLLLGVGFWPAAIVCFLGAVLGRRMDNEVERTTAHAEAVGHDMSKDRMADEVFNFGCGVVFLFIAIFVFITVMNGGG